MYIYVQRLLEKQSITMTTILPGISGNLSHL